MARTPEHPRKARGSRHDRSASLDDAEATARQVAELGLSKKAQDVVLLDLRGVTPRPEVDFFVLMSSVSEPHQRALADHILEELDKRGRRRLHLEGYPASGWILIDFVDVVVHIFRPDSRNFYALETLWGDADSERIDDTPPEAPASRRPDRARAAGAAGARVRPSPGGGDLRAGGRPARKRPAARRAGGSPRTPGRP